MRLLKVSTSVNSDELDLVLCDVHYEDVDYAILSHTWGFADDEVSYHDFTNQINSARNKKGYQKIAACCRQVLLDGLSYVWIDTCCIDKASSAELTEAINSMYRWYEQARVCYVYLEDVQRDATWELNSSLKASRWFTRGWTLQEMIAPAELKFFTSDWTEIGKKTELAELLSEITKVPKEVLLYRDLLEDVCISQKMYWASNRRTTRIEDRAYSLIGLFDISLPIIYGEGDRAFRRLQEEIIRVTFDHTIFAWELRGNCSGLLASSPDAFAASADVKKMSVAHYVKLFNIKNHNIDYSISNFGLEIQMPHFTLKDRPQLYVGFLGCYLSNENKPLHIYIRQDLRKLSSHFFRTRTSRNSFDNTVSIPQLLIPSLSNQPRLWIIEPEKALKKIIQDPIPDEFFSCKKLHELDAKYYVLSVSVPVNQPAMRGGLITAAFPMPQIMSSTYISHISAETRAEEAWVVSISFRRNFTLFLLLAVIDDDLISHLEYKSDVNVYSYDSANAARHCTLFYQRCRSSTELPCTEVALDSNVSSSSNLESLYEDNVAIWLHQRAHYHEKRPCKIFEIEIVVSPRNAVREKTIKGKEKSFAVSKCDKSLKEVLARCKPFTMDIA